MRITFINTLYEPYIGGGAEITVRSIVRGLSERGHDCRVITTSAPGELAEEVVDGISVTRVPVQNLYWHFGENRQSSIKRMLWHWKDQWSTAMLSAVEKVVARNKPEVIFTHNLTGFSSAMWQLGQKFNVPIVQVLHDYYSICPKSTMFSGGRRCMKQCLGCRILRRKHPKASNALSAVVGVSNAVLNQHLNYGYFGEVALKRVINNSREIPAPARAQSSGEFIRFGFIGTLSAPKGLELLLAAFDRMCQRTEKRVELLVAGTGSTDYVSMLKGRFTNPRIQFLGRVKPADFFKSIDISVVPSIWEDPFPGVVFESLGFGVPVIGNALGGIPEMIQDGGNGVLLSPDQIELELENAMLDIVLDPERLRFLAANARQSVSSLLSPRRHIDEYEMLLQDVKANHAKRV